MRREMLVLPAVALLAAGAHAVVYNDATGENFDGNPHMDIVSVAVTNTLSDITFTINLNGPIGPGTDWGKYCIGFDYGAATGDPNSPVGNPWGRNIDMADKMDAWIGSWVDGGGGAQAWTFDGTNWNLNSSVVPTIGPSSTSFTVSLASLGLVGGETICFDVYTTGGNGGDSANDASANPNQSTTGWGGPYTTPSGRCHVYEVVVPEPASISLLGLTGLGLLSRRRAVRA